MLSITWERGFLFSVTLGTKTQNPEGNAINSN